MSKETMTWLNTMTLIGMTDKRGTAWHYREDKQGNEPNHYPGAIPVADVKRRLFDWQAVETPLYVRDITGEFVVVPERKAIVASDTCDVLGVFKSGYLPHQYDAWLVDNVSNILDDDLAISSAGLLKNRAQAWVEISVPENIKTSSGVEFRPNLLACTSFDGSLATTYKRTVQLTVCDNTMAAALGETGQTFKVRHTAGSRVQLANAREALEVVYDTADEFSAFVDSLTAKTISGNQWASVLDKVLGPVDADSSTRAKNIRDEINAMYQYDSRVKPWTGTAFGALQAFNTYRHHGQAVRNASKAERNMSNAITGQTEKADNEVLAALASV